MSAGTEEQIRRYVANNPDANVMDVLGALRLPPTEKDTVARILADHAPDRGEPITSPDGSATENSSEQIDNETETHEGSRVDATGEGESACTLDDNSRDRPTYGTALEAVRDGPLAELGEAFVPIPPGEKGTRRPRTPENLYAPDDDVLEAYLEAGHNYGVVCRNDLAVVDADEPEALRDLLEALPKTAWQVSGSRSSEHHFLLVPGLDEDLPLVDPETDEELGHIKGAEQSYVVGPGSRHPSGNRYGPLVGDAIATVDEADLRELIEPFRPDGVDRSEADHTPVERAARSGGDSGHDLDVYDVLSRGSYPAESRCEHPFHGSSTGANFMVDPDGETWRCWRHDCTGNALHLVGIDEGVISCGDWKHGGLSTDTWREIFAAAREAGYDLPDYDPEEDVDHVTVLPETPVNRAERNVWDWRAAGDDADEDPLQAARDRTQDVLEDALQRYEARVLVEALPTLGKSSGVIRAASATDEPITVLTGRGRKEQYEQFEQWADEQGLTYRTLPAFTHDCPTARGDHGDDWKERVMDWYRRGATPQDIHKYAEQELGRPLPYQVDADGNAHDCEYAHKWNFDPETDGSADPDEDVPIDVLIGHYAHAHKPKVTEGRTVVFDEFPASAYETELGGRLQGAVTQFCQRHEGIPFADYTDLIERRADDSLRADALTWFLEEGALQRDPDEVFAGAAGHAAAPIATFALLASDDLGNGWEHTDLSSADVDELENATALFNREQGSVRILDPPALEYTRGVVGLDGTPTLRMWRRVLGDDSLQHRPVLTDAERREYIEDGLGLQLVPMTDAVKPYNNADYVNIEQDVALLEAIRDEHGEKPGLITSGTALHEYDAADGVDLEALVDDTAYYGNVLGSNEFGTKRVGALIGSTHYGDGFIKKWAAYDGETVERGEEKGADLSYGEVGDEILSHMREHQTLQAAMRFGRDGNGAVVYVHTNTLPEWVPTAGEGRVLATWSDGLRQVLDALEDLGAATTAEIAAHTAVDVGQRQVFDHLETLRSEYGVLERRQDDEDGRRVVWRDVGLARLNEHGDVELDGVSLDDLSDDEVRELARSSIYTWEFTNSAGAGVDSAGVPGSPEVATDGGRLNGGDDPPDVH